MESKNRPLKTLDEPQTYEADSETYARHNILCDGKGVWTLPEELPAVFTDFFKYSLPKILIRPYSTVSNKA